MRRRATFSHHAFHAALLAGASALALLASSQGASAVQIGRAGGTATAAPAQAQSTANTAAQQAAAIAQQSQNALARATQAIQAMQAAQAAARAAAAGATNAPIANGLSVGAPGVTLPGLVVDPRVQFDATTKTDTTTGLWINAKAPTQASTDGKTTVTIEQTAAKAVMTWLYYNVSKDTTVVYDQKGNAGWVALNRIDATGAPSQIRGQIKADGQVLLINPNGIIFSGTSQINVHSLVASALDIGGTAAASAFNKSPAYGKTTMNVDGLGSVDFYTPGTTGALGTEASSNKNFVTNGLFTQAPPSGWGATQALYYGNSAVFAMGDQTLGTQQGGGAIVVDPGAIISASEDAKNVGYVALLGPKVTNAGSLLVANGQIILAAAGQVTLTAPSADPTAVGVHTAFTVNELLGASTVTSPSLGGTGAIVNSGLAQGRTGAITLVGDSISQLGVLETTTSVAQPGSIKMSATSGDIVFGPSSLTAILPDPDSGETPAATVASTIYDKLGYALGSYFSYELQPQISIYAAKGIDFQAGSLLKAPSAAAAITAGTVVLEAGATIDLSGLADVEVPVSSFFVTFTVTPNEVANSPLADFLVGKKVTIDTRLSGTRADGVAWVGSPVVDASGYAGLIPKSISEILTVGGNLTLIGGNFVQQPGSLVNVSGGYVTYTGAEVNTSRLIGADGRFYDIGKADPSVAYVGLANSGYTVSYSHGQVTETYTNPLLDPSYYEPTYIAGASAGSIDFGAVRTENGEDRTYSVNAYLGGQILASTVAGPRQRANAIGGGATAQTSLEQLPQGGSLTILPTGGYLLEDSAQAGADPFGLANYQFGDSLPFARTVMPFLTDILSAANFASITIKAPSGAGFYGNMAQGATLAVAAGGRVTLSGLDHVDGSIIAHGGAISITGESVGGDGTLAPHSDLIIGAHALLDVSGLWINDTGAANETLTGSAFINGGSVSFSTINTSTSSGVSGGAPTTATDVTQSVVLAPGSIIDLSSGGYVGVNGKLKMASNGLPAGKGGNLSVNLYAGNWVWRNDFNKVSNFAPRGTDGNFTASVQFGGAIYSRGFQSGGAFSLQASAISIDGAATAITAITSGADAGTIVLPTSFFTDNGFSSYNLTSIYGDAEVAANTTLLLRQTNYLTPSVLAPTGAKVRDFAAIGLAPTGLRSPVSLALTQKAFIINNNGLESNLRPANLLIDSGARIIAEASKTQVAAITLGATASKVTLAGTVTVLGEIVAPGGAINLGSNAKVRVGSSAVLDVSGEFVPDPTVVRYDTGVALPGGVITMVGATTVAEEGSLFLLDGASGSVEIGAGFGRFARQAVWSDGGVLQMAGPDLTGSFAGTVSARGGSSLASGGVLRIGLLPSQIPSALNPFKSASIDGNLPLTIVVEPTASLASAASLSGVYIGADTLNNSGFNSLELTTKAGAIAFNGDATITAPGSIKLNGNIVLMPSTATPLPTGVTNAANYRAPACAPAGACAPSIGKTTVTLNAPYVSFGQPGTGANGNSDGYVAPALADGTFAVNAQWIDFGSRNLSLINVGDAIFTSADAIRLIGVNPAATSNGGGNVYVGALYTAGNLTLNAAEVYPTTSTVFALVANGAVAGYNTLTVNQTGAASMPLSAGGTLILDAVNINQNGTLWAPLGQIYLGLTPTLTSSLNSSFSSLGLKGTVTASNVTLGAGSLTSVSAAGALIPFGITVDGSTWYEGDVVWNINSSTYGGVAITASATGVAFSNNSNLANKAITLSGANVAAAAGATLDLSGGGDIYASEFVSGTGGTTNVLTTYASGSTVYALVPTSKAKVALYDPTFAFQATTAATTISQSSFGSSLLTATPGAAITIAGGNGIEAGTYVLMPGMYATLPGAYRVVATSASVNSTTPVNAVLADGSILVSGVFSNVLTGAQSSKTTLFQIQSQSTWSRYSRIDITSGTKFISALATKAGVAAPMLPIDGGLLTLGATSTLNMGSTNLFGPGVSELVADIAGRGGQAAISAAKILVLARGLNAPDADTGYLKLDVDQLNDLGATTLLIGGTSIIDGSGNLAITANATDLEIETDAAHALTAPQLLLVAKSGGRGLVIDDGSVLGAAGVTPAGSDRSIVVAGEGALMRMSTGSVVTVTRTGASAGTGSILIGATAGTSTLAAAPIGVTINGGVALTLDSSGSILPNVGAGAVALTAVNYDFGAKIVNFGGGSTGLVMTPALLASLAGANSVKLRSASVIDFYDAGGLSIGDAAKPIGTLTLDASGLYGNGGATTIHAANIVLTDSQKTPNATGALAAAGGALTFDASGTVTFGAGATTLGNFATVEAKAGNAIRFAGSGSYNAGAANVTLSAPGLVAAAGSTQAVTTSGLLTLASSGPAPVVAAAEIGGAITFTAGAIVDSAAIVARSGNVTLTGTSGDVTLRAGALIDAGGSEIVLGSVIADAPGGIVKLVSQTGGVTVDSGARVSVASAGRGYAGTLSISAAGNAALNGVLDGSADPKWDKGLGGSFVLVANGMSGALPWGGFSRRFAVSLANGDIKIGAGSTLSSREVLLLANNGSIIVDGAIDASGATGGIIQLYGAGVTTNGVTTGGVFINAGAKLDAHFVAPAADDPAYANGTSELHANGGAITLGTTGWWDGVSYNADGSQKIAPGGSGVINVASGAVIDLRAGAGGTGGSLTLRAPITTDADGKRNVNVSVYKNAADTVAGAASVTLNAYETWSTTDNAATTGGDKHFDGIIDPAGWFNASGQIVPGSWTNLLALPTSVMTSAGSGYTAPPTVAIAGAGWNGVTAQAVMAAQTGSITALTNAGGGFVAGTYYCNASACTYLDWGTGVSRSVWATISSADGVGSGATISQVVVGANGAIRSFSISNGGSGYDQPLNVTITGLAGTTAATATVNLKVLSVAVGIPSGPQPTQAPTSVTFSGGGGSGASVTNYASFLTGAKGTQGSGFFTPTAPNADHVAFYQTTLKGFVNDPFGGNGAAVAANFGANLQSTLHLRPEMDLVNPSAAINGGNVTVASNWNLGAGVYNSTTGAFALAYRTGDGEPGMLTLRAANNVNVNATITDGFYEATDPLYVLAIPDSVTSTTGAAAAAAASYSSQLATFTGDYMPGVASILAPPASFPTTFSAVGQNTWLAQIYAGYLTSLSSLSQFATAASSRYIVNGFDNDPTHYSSYAAYVAAYNAQYVGANYIPAETTTKFSSPFGLVALRDFDNNPAHYGSYAQYAQTYNNYASAMKTVIANYYKTDTSGYRPSTILAPIPPVLGTVYASGRIEDATTFLTSYAGYGGYAPAGGGGLYGGYYLGFYLNKVEPGWIDGKPSSGGQALWMLAMPYLPDPALTPLTTGASAPGAIANSIANNPARNVTIDDAGNAVVINDVNTTSAATLMSAMVSPKGSFSYDFVAGALFADPNKPSADPNAVAILADAVNAAAPTSSIVITGHTAYTVVNTSYTAYVPTLVRTGVGSITLTAAGNVEFTDPVVQGAVYTAGAAQATPADFNTLSLAVAYLKAPNGLASTPAWGAGGGSVIVNAGQSIIGIDVTKTPSGTVTTQNSNDWYFRAGVSDGDATPFSACATSGNCQSAAWINFGTFFQNFGALGGGDITLRAGADITDISASAPETMLVAGGFTGSNPPRMIKFGGGSLLVQAGGNINSGKFIVGLGTGRIEAGGSIRKTADNPITAAVDAALYPLILGIQDANVGVVARGALEIGKVVDIGLAPNFLTLIGVSYSSYTTSLNVNGLGTSNGVGNGFNLMSQQSGLSVLSVSGDIGLDTMAKNALVAGPFLPPDLSVVAANGNVTLGTAVLLPAPTDGAGHDAASLTIAAAGNVDTGTLDMTVATSVIGVNPNTSSFVYFNPLGLSTIPLAPESLTDNSALTIYAGKDVSGTATLTRYATVTAGRDIKSFTFNGANRFAGDITALIAGRDIVGSTLKLSGPGTLLVEAGRDIALPQNTANVATLKGIMTTGGADLQVLYGVAGGIDYAAAISAYVDPANGGAFLAEIAAQLGLTDRAAAWAMFQTLTPLQQQALVNHAFNAYLIAQGSSSTDLNSSGLTAAYKAMAILFPAGMGYAHDGKTTTGILNMPLSVLETQAGGDIDILGPGGLTRVGTVGKDMLTPAQEGILTLAGGTIRIYSDQSVLVNQSRIMTEQGGDVDVFSANGDINAGSGPKTYVSTPVLSYVCDSVGYCPINPQGLVTGAGIGAIVTLPGQDPTKSNAHLIAPHGTIDAGAAGIRVSGDSFFLAQIVRNAYNIQVGGKTTGLPVTQGPSLGALTTASNAAGAVSKTVDSPRAAGGSDAPSIIIVEVIGYGGGDGAPDTGAEPRRRKPDAQGAELHQDPNSPVRVIGAGRLTPDQQQWLTTAELKAFNEP